MDAKDAMDRSFYVDKRSDSKVLVSGGNWTASANHRAHKMLRVLHEKAKSAQGPDRAVYDAAADIALLLLLQAEDH